MRKAVAPCLLIKAISASVIKWSNKRSKKNWDLFGPRVSAITALRPYSEPGYPLIKFSRFIQPPRQTPRRLTGWPWESTIWSSRTLRRNNEFTMMIPPLSQYILLKSGCDFLHEQFNPIGFWTIREPKDKISKTQIDIGLDLRGNLVGSASHWTILRKEASLMDADRK